MKVVDSCKDMKIVNYIKEKNKLFYGIVLILLSVLYFGVYWNRSIPYTEGWGLAYVDLIFDGRFPYRDFYYYLPPLNLVIDAALWKLSFDYMILYRVWRIIERMVIELILYNVLCKVTKPKFACLASFFGAIISAATVYDLLGDYNQTCDLLAVILVWIFLKYADAFYKSETKKEFKYLFISGIIIGLSFLLKQTIVVAEVIIYFTFLTMLFVMKKKSNYIKSVLTTFAGAMIPVVLCLIILAANRAIVPFFEQVFLNVSSKGSPLDILLAPFNFFNIETIYFVSMAVITIVIFCWLKKSDWSSAQKNMVAIITYVFALYTIYMFYYGYIAGICMLAFDSSKLIFIFTIPMLYTIATAVIKKYTLKKIDYISQEALCIFLLVCSILSLKSMPILTASLYEVGKLIFVDKLPYVTTVGAIVYFIHLVRKYHKTNDIKILRWLFLLAGGFVMAYTTAMACGDSPIGNRSMIILFPVMFVVILELEVYNKKIFHTLITMCSIMLCVMCMSQKIANAYSWWGWEGKDPIISEENNYEINVPGLEGFRTSADIKEMYEKMYRVIKENTDENSTIYGFPHIRIFNVLLDNVNMDHFVPVPFYDVCERQYAKEDAKLLEKNPPDIVIWCDMPYCMETHENLFHEGERLGQRDIQEWFSEAVANKEYICIGQYDALYVYKKFDGTYNFGYTYWQDGARQNSTLLYEDKINE